MSLIPPDLERVMIVSCRLIGILSRLRLVQWSDGARASVRFSVHYEAMLERCEPTFLRVLKRRERRAPLAANVCHSILRVSIVTIVLAVQGAAWAAPTVESNSVPGNLLLLDSLGRVVSVPANEVPSALRPAAGLGMERQIPNPTTGASMPQEIMQRTRAGAAGFGFFPAQRPPLMPYLASEDEYGNTAIRPGSLFFFTSLEGPVQNGKYWLSEYGFRYSLDQTFTFVSMTDVKKGDSDLGYYTFDFKSKWALFNAPDAGTAGWISSQVEAKNGLESAGNTQSAKSNLGTVTDPTGIWSDVNGFRVPELAWQQSARHGEIVVVAGMVSQRNYIDANAYADSGRSKFMNSALINSDVLPLAQYNFGINLQWQPVDEWYAMAGASMGDAKAGNAPWTDFSGQNWSLPGEIGYAPRDFFDLAPAFIASSRLPPQWMAPPAADCALTSSSNWVRIRHWVGSGVLVSAAKKCPTAPPPRRAPGLSCKDRSNICCCNGRATISSAQVSSGASLRPRPRRCITRTNTFGRRSMPCN